jgi:hypothetical protein
MNPNDDRRFYTSDKFIITMAVLILGICAFIWGVVTKNSPENIITAIVSGLFGMGTGVTLAQRQQLNPVDKAAVEAAQKIAEIKVTEPVVQPEKKEEVKEDAKV